MRVRVRSRIDVRVRTKVDVVKKFDKTCVCHLKSMVGQLKSSKETIMSGNMGGPALQGLAHV